MSSERSDKHNNAKINLGYLDGLRGILCILVLIEHCINFYKPDIRFTELEGITGLVRRLIISTPLNIMYNGDVAVYIFFALSGFVLSLSFNRSKNHDVILSGVIKRYPRIMLPVAGSMVLMYVVMLFIDTYVGQAFGLQLFNVVEQVFYKIPFTHSILTNYPLWSMSYELYGSLLVFSLLAIFGRSKHRILFYSMVMVYFMVSLNQAHQDIFEYSTYYALFVFGMIMSDITNGGAFKINPYIRLAMFSIGLYLATIPLPRENIAQYIGAYTYLKVFDGFSYMQVSITIGVIGSMILFASIIDSNVAMKFLSTNVVRFLGNISFPLYLNHAIVIYVISYVLHKKYEQIGIVEFIIATCLTILISVPIAYLFEKFIDAPSIRASNKLSKLICK
ncbi:acyltransferase family protein [Enterobacter roggenkampii]|uniref:acyltransferase family protein n=2 Tax=Enterobacteriaceae TaxID=543 RepID=UPI002075E580|nr:acyltransferase [Enterobacter roggenkampii]MCM7560025.1 acyltransferase [Enterobacter roggenkampii]